MDWADVDDNTVCLKNLITFTDYYVSKIVGSREVDRFHKDNRDKTLLDKLTPSDYAYATLMYENTVAVWKDQHARKVGGMQREEESEGDDAGVSNRVRVQQKYHFAKGTRLRTFACGWTRKGVEYMRELEGKFKDLWNDKAFLNRVKKEWSEYAEEQGKYQYKARGSAVAAVDDGLGNFDNSAFLLEVAAPSNGVGDINDEDPILDD